VVLDVSVKEEACSPEPSANSEHHGGAGGRRRAAVSILERGDFGPNDFPPRSTPPEARQEIAPALSTSCMRARRSLAFRKTRRCPTCSTRCRQELDDNRARARWRLAGILTDGDLRRLWKAPRSGSSKMRAADGMTKIRKHRPARAFAARP